MAHDDPQIKEWPKKVLKIGEIKPSKYNPRGITEEAESKLTHSLEEFGLVEDIVVNERDGQFFIVGGHQRWKILKKKGIKKVRATVMEISEGQERALNIALNTPEAQGHFIDYMLRDMAESFVGMPDITLDDLDDLGIIQTLEKMDITFQDNPFESPSTSESDSDFLGDDDEDDDEPERGRDAEDDDGDDFDDEPEELRKVDERYLADPVTQTGDIWVLGRHYLMCGDSLDYDDMAELLGNKKPSLVCTDPPYNLVGEEQDFLIGSGSNQKFMDMMAEAGWDEGFDITTAVHTMLDFADKDASFYVFVSDHLFGEARKAFDEHVDTLNFCVYHKNNPAPSLAKRHWTWSAELIVYATRGKHTFNFPDMGNAPSVLTFNKDAHIISTKYAFPCAKPRAMIRHIVMHSSEEFAIVLDMFGGSGTTILACEDVDRICYMMERDPRNCDKIMQRWVDETGVTPVRRGDEVRFDSYGCLVE